MHRSCYYAQDDEVSSLLASDSESLPTEEEEAAAIAIQRYTPLTVQVEEAEMAEVYQFDTAVSDVDITFPDLVTNYPDEDFDSIAFQRLTLHKYLTSEVTKMEFFLMNNQWPADDLVFGSVDSIKMRKGVHERSGKLWHIGCIDDDSREYKLCYFTHGILTIQARTKREFITLVAENPNYFFCAKCEHYIFDGVFDYTDEQFKIPNSDIWPTCSYLKQSSTLHNTGDETFASLHVQQLIAIISPSSQEVDISDE